MTAAKSRRTKVLVPVLLAVLVAGLAAALLRQQGRVAGPASPATGPAVTATLPRLNGEPLNLADYRGKVLAVNIFAAWCSSCWEEIRGFERVSRDYGSRGVAVVGISVQTSPEDTRAMIDKLGVTFPVGLDPQGTVSQETLGLRGMPTTLFFDRQGRLLENITGKVSEGQLRAKLDGLL
jgi:peroxiredoxin